MKLYKSYILAGLIALGFTACDTDDLERDINALKDRVENYEAQVQKLNDDMNIIRVLLDGNKTISEWSYDGSTYTLKLSNGETLTLTDGVIGTNYPSIEIGDNGNWIIAGKDSGIRAVAEDGDDATFTPQFKIEGGNWCVSHDNGQTWSNLGVSATGTPTEATSPIKNIDTETDPNYITITLSDDSVHKIPVIKNLICAIQKTDLADDGLLYLGYGESKTIKVDVNIEPGDIIRPVVPAEWKAEITTTDYSSKTGAQTLDVEVTAPMNASKCVVTIEVNRGANTITDEIVARTETKSYYDDYMAGLDIEIGGVKINRKDYPVEEITNSVIDKKGVYFLDKDADVSITASSLEYLVLLCDDGMGKCAIPSTISLGNGLGVLAKNIEFTCNNIYFKITKQIDNIVFDNCNVFVAEGKNVMQSDVDESIKNIFSITNSNFKFNNTKFAASRVLNSDGKALSCRILLDNNIFYSASRDWAVNGTVVFCNTADISSLIDVTNNTFINFVTASQSLIKGTFKGSVNFNNLLFWVYKNNWSTTDYKNMSLLFVTNAEPIGTGINSDKILFYVDFLDGLETELNLNLFSGTRPSGLTAKSFPAEETDPFTGEGCLFDFGTGQFKPSTNYAEYGAQRNY